jgi:hypothetical protein
VDDDDDHNNDRELTRKLAQLPGPEPSAALRRAVAEIPLRHPRAQGALAWPLRSLWQAALSATFVAALGLAAGFATAEPETDEGWDELRALAFAIETGVPLDEELEQ